MMLLQGEQDDREEEVRKKQKLQKNDEGLEERDVLKTLRSLFMDEPLSIRIKVHEEQ